jgi:hypothetical protein
MGEMLITDSMSRPTEDVVARERKLPWLCRIRFCQQSELFAQGTIEGQDDDGKPIFVMGKVFQCPHCKRKAIVLGDQTGNTKT